MASPGHPSATVRMAMVWHVRGDDARAIRLIERVIATVPGQQEAHYDLAIIRFSRREISAAREAWVQAAEIDPASRLGRASQNFVDLLSDGDGAGLGALTWGAAAARNAGREPRHSGGADYRPSWSSTTSHVTSKRSSYSPDSGTSISVKPPTPSRTVPPSSSQ